MIKWFKDFWKQLKQLPSVVVESLEHKMTNDSIENQIWMVTGLKGEDAKRLVDLLLRYLCYDDSVSVQRDLANLGVRVGQFKKEPTVPESE